MKKRAAVDKLHEVFALLRSEMHSPKTHRSLAVVADCIQDKHPKEWSSHRRLVEMATELEEGKPRRKLRVIAKWPKMCSTR